MRTLPRDIGIVAAAQLVVMSGMASSAIAIDVPRPTVPTINIPKPQIQVPRPTVPTINIPKPQIQVPRPILPAVQRPTVPTATPKVLVTTPKVTGAPPRAAVTTPKATGTDTPTATSRTTVTAPKAAGTPAATGVLRSTTAKTVQPNVDSKTAPQKALNVAPGSNTQPAAASATQQGPKATQSGLGAVKASAGVTPPSEPPGGCTPQTCKPDQLYTSGTQIRLWNGSTWEAPPAPITQTLPDGTRMTITNPGTPYQTSTLTTADGRTITIDGGGPTPLSGTILGQQISETRANGQSVVTVGGQMAASCGYSSCVTGGGAPAGNDGRAPIFVMDSNGRYQRSYWSTVPNDVVARYGPLSDASRLPTLQYGFGSDRQPIYNQDGERSYWSTVPTDVSQRYGPLSEASNLPTPTGTPRISSNAPAGGGSEAANGLGNGTPGDPQPAQGPDTPGSSGSTSNISTATDTSPIEADTGLTLAQQQAQVDANTKIIAQQIRTDAALPTSPPETEYGAIFGINACGTETCRGFAFAIDSHGVNGYVTDPNYSMGTPQGSVYAQIAVNPNSVAGGDSITASVGDYAVSMSATSGVPDGKGYAVGVSFGSPLPSISQTRGLPIGNILPTTPPNDAAGGSYQIITDRQGNIWGQKPNGDIQLTQRVAP